MTWRVYPPRHGRSRFALHRLGKDSLDAKRLPANHGRLVSGGMDSNPNECSCSSKRGRVIYGFRVFGAQALTNNVVRWSIEVYFDE